MHKHQQKPPPRAPHVYRPQPVPKVLQTKTIPGRQINLRPAPPVVTPRAGRPEPVKPVQARGVLQQRKAPVAPPVYRPQPKSPSIQPKTASPAQRGSPAPPARPVIQRYTSINTKGFRGKISQHGRYVTGKDLSEMYVFPGNNVERSYNTGRTRQILGTTYQIWKPSFLVIGDCVAAMEELLHGKKMKYGAPDLSEYRDLGGKKRKVFGESDSDNRKRGKVTDLGEGSDPKVGEGYVISRQGTDRHLSLPQFHGAAVVAQDGEDNITLEASAPLSGSIPDDRVHPVYDMYAVLKKRQSFKGRYKAMYGKDATVSVIKKKGGRIPQKVIDDPQSDKVVEYVY